MLFHWFRARIKDSEQYTSVEFSWTFYFDRVLRICIGHTLKIKFGPYPGKFIFCTYKMVALMVICSNVICTKRANINFKISPLRGSCQQQHWSVIRLLAHARNCMRLEGLPETPHSESRCFAQRLTQKQFRDKQLFEVSILGNNRDTNWSCWAGHIRVSSYNCLTSH